VKISQASVIALVAGIVVIALASLGWTYWQQHSQKQQLETRLAESQQKLNAIRFDDLEGQLSQLERDVKEAEAELDAAKSGLVFPDDSIDVTGALLEEASSSNVKVTSLSSPGLGGKNLAGTQCEILTLSIQVNGEVIQINDFIHRLSKRFPTGIVESVSISGGGAAPAPEVTPSDTLTPPETLSPDGSPSTGTVEKGYTGSITLVIHNYKVVQDVE
jgi:TolA-binding protein